MQIQIQIQNQEKPDHETQLLKAESSLLSGESVIFTEYYRQLMVRVNFEETIYTFDDRILFYNEIKEFRRKMYNKFLLWLNDAKQHLSPEKIETILYSALPNSAYKNTLLHYACRYSWKKVVETILKHTQNKELLFKVNSQNRDALSVLCLSSRYKNDKTLYMFRILLSAMASHITIPYLEKILNICFRLNKRMEYSYLLLKFKDRAAEVYELIKGKTYLLSNSVLKQINTELQKYQRQIKRNILTISNSKYPLLPLDVLQHIYSYLHYDI